MALQYESLARQLLTISQQLAALKLQVGRVAEDTVLIKTSVCLSEDDEEWQEDMDEDTPGSGSDTDPLDEKEDPECSRSEFHSASKLFALGGAKARKLCDD